MPAVVSLLLVPLLWELAQTHASSFLGGTSFEDPGACPERPLLSGGRKAPRFLTCPEVT